MSKMYWQLFYHFVWTTKGRVPLVSDEVEEVVAKCTRAKCEELGCRLYAIGAAPDHLHLLVTVPPSLRVSDFLMHVKGASSHLVNQALTLDAPFHWQRGCGVLSVSSSDKLGLIEYIRSQRRRHDTGETWPSLEKTE